MKAGIFKKPAKARERTHVLESLGVVKNAGKVRMDGRPHDLWSTWEVANRQHEAELTETIIHLRPLGVVKIVRGPNVDVRYHADAEITMANGTTFYVEYDRNSMGRAPLTERMNAYVGCPHHVLWICPNRPRVEAMKQWAAGIEAPFWFTTFAEILANAAGQILENVLGEKDALVPRQEQ